MTATVFLRTIGVLALAAVVACGGGQNATQPVQSDTTQPAFPGTEAEMTGQKEEDLRAPAIPSALVDTWTLVEVDGIAVPDAGKTPTLVIVEDGTVTGVGGVNRFRTEVEIVDGRLSFGPAAATKMAGPPEAMELESTYLARLGSVTTYEVDGNTLVMWAGNNEALTFDRADVEP